MKSCMKRKLVGILKFINLTPFQKVTIVFQKNVLDYKDAEQEVLLHHQPQRRVKRGPKGMPLEESQLLDYQTGTLSKETMNI